jgi:hypothetical protein
MLDLKSIEMPGRQLLLVTSIQNSFIFATVLNRGALKFRAEIKLFEPAPGNAGEGNLE